MFDVRDSGVRRAPPRFHPMRRQALAFVIGAALVAPAGADTLLSIAAEDYEVTPRFNDVSAFEVSIELEAPLAPGLYANPEIRTVTYGVSGRLNVATPSTFERFDLQRSIDGAEFYAQGSSLSFEIADTAVLDDGVQVAELVGNALVFSLDARELGTMRFHPPRLELRADGTGRLQNSSNVPSLDPRVEVDAGAEYVTDLAFDPGNTTLLTVRAAGGGGGGAPFLVLALLALPILWRRSGAPKRAA